MIEKFAEQYRLGSSLAYMSFLQRINFNTGLLDWNETRTGYAMESPVRHLFLTKLKIENPESFSQIHEFLMDENWRFAMQLSGTDKLHSIQVTSKSGEDKASYTSRNLVFAFRVL